MHQGIGKLLRSQHKCRYILISLPGVWLDTIDRPMNRMLIAQSIARPQMWISGFGVLSTWPCRIALNTCLGHMPLLPCCVDGQGRFG